MKNRNAAHMGWFDKAFLVVNCAMQKNRNFIFIGAANPSTRKHVCRFRLEMSDMNADIEIPDGIKAIKCKLQNKRAEWKKNNYLKLNGNSRTYFILFLTITIFSSVFPIFFSSVSFFRLFRLRSYAFCTFRFVSIIYWLEFSLFEHESAYFPIPLWNTMNAMWHFVSVLHRAARDLLAWNTYTVAISHQIRYNFFPTSSVSHSIYHLVLILL